MHNAPGVTVYSFHFTFCSNLSISIFVRSLQECFGLLIGQVSPICSKTLQNKPAERKQSESNTCQTSCLLAFILRVSIINVTGYKQWHRANPQGPPPINHKSEGVWGFNLAYLFICSFI